VDTALWRIKYTNLFAQLVGNALFTAGGTRGTGEFPQKFMAMHHLDVSVTDNLNIGLFESVIYGEPDSLGGGLEAQYLNPIIFYRALEQQDGSPDNVIIGADFNWHLWNRMTLYGQLVVDEMIVSELFSGEGWWGNKQGFQLGAKYFDAFGVPNLMLQGEWNAVRPYTYAHDDFYTSYTHYNMPLAHPLGANFREVLGKLDYQFFDKWRIQLIGLRSEYGNDINGRNFGRNPTLSDDNRDTNGDGINDDYGNTWLQGERAKLYMMSTRLSYQFRPNLFLDGDLTVRDETQDGRSAIVGFSFRWNFPERFYLF
jgi:hypothetical protein